MSCAHEYRCVKCGESPSSELNELADLAATVVSDLRTEQETLRKMLDQAERLTKRAEDL